MTVNWPQNTKHGWCGAGVRNPKTQNIVVIGQVTKDGKMAGSNKLKHMVDSHIHLSVEQKDEDLRGCRVIETKKNRFGGCGHTVFLKLRKNGFTEVARLTASGV